MKKVVTAFVSAAVGLGLVACGNNKTVDTKESTSDVMVYKNGNIYTSNANHEYASCVVVEDGKFVYVGDDEGAAEYEKNLPAENIVDLEGSLVTPGFIEGHTHFSFMAAMNSLNYVEIPSNLNKEQSIEEVKKFVEAHPDYDQYVLGNFSQQFELGTKELDEICKDKPIMCVGMGLHCGYVNSKFLELGGIDENSKDAVPNESYYQRDENGKPTGKIVELTQTWVAFEQAIKVDSDKVKEAYKQMIDLYHGYGFTGVAEGGFLGLDEYKMLNVLKDLEKDGDLNMVVCPSTIWYGSNVLSLEDFTEKAVDIKENYTTDLIRTGTVKMWADGTIGAHSALMRNNYDDMDTKGVQLNTVEDLTAAAEMCKENDLNIHYHAIGDQAIENVLTAFETVGETSGQKSIVHFQISTPDLIERASKIDDLILNMTPLWGNVLADEEVSPVNSLREYYGLFKECMDAGLTVNFGADSNGPKECWNPASMILVAMNRNPDEEGLFLKGKPCTFEEAIEAYTINVAKERRIDDEFGSIEVGKSADFVVWNVDGLTDALYAELLEQDINPTDKGVVYAEKTYFKGNLVKEQ